MATLVKPTTLVLIDGPYLLAASKDREEIDFKILRRVIEEQLGLGPKEAQIRFYTRYFGGRWQEEFFQDLKRLGFQVRKNTWREDVDGFIEQDLWKEIEGISPFSQIAVLSGDGRYLGLLRLLQYQGKRVVVLGFPDSVHSLLRGEFEWIDLSQYPIVR